MLRLALLSLLLGAAKSFARTRLPVDLEINRLSPAALAYIGDAVFEVAVRERLLWPPSKLNDLSSRVEAIVRAEGQYALLERIVAGFGLSEDEHEWL